MIAIMNVISLLAFAISDIIVINPNLNQNESKQKYLLQNAKFTNSRNSKERCEIVVHIGWCGL